MKHSLRHCELEISYTSRNVNGQQERSVIYLSCAAPAITQPELELMLEYLNSFEDDTVPLEEAFAVAPYPAAQNDNSSSTFLREIK